MRKHNMKFNVTVLCAAIIIAALFLGVFEFWNKNILPIATEMSIMQAKSDTAVIVKESILAYLEKNPLTYSDFISTVRNEKGDITELVTITNNVNLVNAQLSRHINEELAKGLKKEVYIPLGTLSDIPAFTGIGPKIKIHATPASAVTTEIKSVFSSAGINQSLHQIVLDISAELSGVQPLSTPPVRITANYIIAEVLINGKVPLE